MLKLANPFDLFYASVSFTNATQQNTLSKNDLQKLSLKIQASVDSNNSLIEDLNKLIESYESVTNINGNRTDFSEHIAKIQRYLQNESYSLNEKIDFILDELSRLNSSNNVDQNIRAQLGCELLKLGDPKNAIEVFKSLNSILFKNNPKFQYDYALALVESNELANKYLAFKMLEDLINSNVFESKENIDDYNKIVALMITTNDQLSLHKEAATYVELLSDDYKSDSIFEKLVIIKYNHQRFETNSTEDDFRTKVIAPLITLTNNNRILEKLDSEKLNADFSYLLGLGYSFQNKLAEANECFKFAIKNFSDDLLLVKFQSYASFRMLSCAIWHCDQSLVEYILTTIKIDPDFIPQGLSTSPLFDAASDCETNIPSLLITHGADPFKIFEIFGNRTPFHVAVSTFNMKMVKAVSENFAIANHPYLYHGDEADISDELASYKFRSSADLEYVTKCLDILGYEYESAN